MNFRKSLTVLLTIFAIISVLGIHISATELPTITVTTEMVSDDGEVKAKITLENNPGIVSMLLRVKYDPEVMTLMKADDAGKLGNIAHSDDLTLNPYILFWSNGTSKQNFTCNGEIATLTFKTSVGAEYVKYPIEVSYDRDMDAIFDADLLPVDFEVNNPWHNPYRDVSSDDWFYKYVKYATVNKLMNGIYENTFAPNDAVTRAMFVTVLYRLEGEPETESTVFKDVEKDAYYADAVSWANKTGIALGVSKDEYAPDKEITREQMVTMFYRYAVYTGMDAVATKDNLTQFADAASINDYAVASFNLAVETGIIKGRENNLLVPHGNATRAEMATILQRYVELNK